MPISDEELDLMERYCGDLEGEEVRRLVAEVRRLHDFEVRFQTVDMMLERVRAALENAGEPCGYVQPHVKVHALAQRCFKAEEPAAAPSAAPEER